MEVRTFGCGDIGGTRLKTYSRIYGISSGVSKMHVFFLSFLNFFHNFFFQKRSMDDEKTQTDAY